MNPRWRARQTGDGLGQGGVSQKLSFKHEHTSDILKSPCQLQITFNTMLALLANLGFHEAMKPKRLFGLWLAVALFLCQQLPGIIRPLEPTSA